MKEGEISRKASEACRNRSEIIKPVCNLKAITSLEDSIPIKIDLVSGVNQILNKIYRVKLNSVKE